SHTPLHPNRPADQAHQLTGRTAGGNTSRDYTGQRPGPASQAPRRRHSDSRYPPSTSKPCPEPCEQSVNVVADETRDYFVGASLVQGGGRVGGGQADGVHPGGLGGL